MKMDHQKEKFYQKKWFAIIMLIFLAPVGIYLIWTNDHFKRNTNIVLTVIFSLLFIVVIFSEEDELVEADNEANEVEEVDETEDILTVVELTLDAEINEDMVVFYGETNLPDGAIITYEVFHEEDVNQFEAGNVKVEKGRYDEEVLVTDWTEGEITVWVSFQTVLDTSTSQPDEVIEIFGEMGENIDGDHVIEIETMKLVELEHSLFKEAVIVAEETEKEEPEKVASKAQDETLDSEKDVNESSEVSTEVEVAKAPKASKSEKTSKSESDETTTKNDQGITTSQQNAVDMAESYLAYTSFSKSGLIGQLKYEGFTSGDAEYAVNAISVDWRDQAVIMAGDYLAYSAFSKSGLIGQLEYEGFASGDAEYAVNAISVDWREQAVIMAGDYLAYSAFSKSGLIGQLEYEGFASGDAEYAVNAISVDWQDQAVKTAEQYLDYTSFSRSDLIDQLKYEGFSSEHANHAADEVGL